MLSVNLIDDRNNIKSHWHKSRKTSWTSIPYAWMYSNIVVMATAKITVIRMITGMPLDLMKFTWRWSMRPIYQMAYHFHKLEMQIRASSWILSKNDREREWVRELKRVREGCLLANPLSNDSDKAHWKWSDLHFAKALKWRNATIGMKRRMPWERRKNIKRPKA